MKSEIEKARELWELANEALWTARSSHLRSPTPEHWKAVTGAANRWERAAAAWSLALTAAGNRKAQRAELVKATTMNLTKGRKTLLH